MSATAGRRTIVRSAVWAPPAVVLAATSPAFASSPPFSTPTSQQFLSYSLYFYGHMVSANVVAIAPDKVQFGARKPDDLQLGFQISIPKTLVESVGRWSADAGATRCTFTFDYHFGWAVNGVARGGLTRMTKAVPLSGFTTGVSIFDQGSYPWFDTSPLAVGSRIQFLRGRLDVRIDAHRGAGAQSVWSASGYAPEMSPDTPLTGFTSYVSKS